MTAHGAGELCPYTHVGRVCGQVLRAPWSCLGHPAFRVPHSRCLSLRSPTSAGFDADAIESPAQLQGYKLHLWMENT